MGNARKKTAVARARDFSWGAHLHVEKKPHHTPQMPTANEGKKEAAKMAAGRNGGGARKQDGNGNGNNNKDKQRQFKNQKKIIVQITRNDKGMARQGVVMPKPPAWMMSSDKRRSAGTTGLPTPAQQGQQFRIPQMQYAQMCVDKASYDVESGNREYDVTLHKMWCALLAAEEPAALDPKEDPTPVEATARSGKGKKMEPVKGWSIVDSNVETKDDETDQASWYEEADITSAANDVLSNPHEGCIRHELTFTGENVKGACMLKVHKTKADDGKHETTLQLVIICCEGGDAKGATTTTLTPLAAIAVNCCTRLQADGSCPIPTKVWCMHGIGKNSNKDTMGMLIVNAAKGNARHLTNLEMKTLLDNDLAECMPMPNLRPLRHMRALRAVKDLKIDPESAWHYHITVPVAGATVYTISRPHKKKGQQTSGGSGNATMSEYVVITFSPLRTMETHFTIADQSTECGSMMMLPCDGGAPAGEINEASLASSGKGKNKALHQSKQQQQQQQRSLSSGSTVREKGLTIRKFVSGKDATDDLEDECPADILEERGCKSPTKTAKRSLSYKNPQEHGGMYGRTSVSSISERSRPISSGNVFNAPMPLMSSSTASFLSRQNAAPQPAAARAMAAAGPLSSSSSSFSSRRHAWFTGVMHSD
jgi:hypothetical protein